MRCPQDLLQVLFHTINSTLESIQAEMSRLKKIVKLESTQKHLGMLQLNQQNHQQVLPQDSVI